MMACRYLVMQVPGRVFAKDDSAESIHSQSGVPRMVRLHAVADGTVCALASFLLLLAVLLLCPTCTHFSLLLCAHVL